MNKCIYCGSDKLVKNVYVSFHGSVEHVGPVVKKGVLSRSSLPMYADICKECGSISRLYVDPKMLEGNLVTKKGECSI